MSREKNNSKKLVAITGTTASGKTGLGVYLAKKFNGEIISADSRQVYKGMDIGTGKDLDEYKIKNQKSPAAHRTAGQAKIKKIPYHLIDIVSPRTEFNLAKFQDLAYKAIGDIWSRGKLPIIVGGTGLYLQAVLEGFELSSGKPDKKLRKKLEQKTIEQLFSKLKKLDEKKANSLNESDKKNKRRLIRYIEITSQKSKVKSQNHNSKFKNETLLIGVTYPKEVLHKRIYKRLIERLDKEDMIGEVERLRSEGVSWKRLIGFGLEYKYIALYLRGEISYDEMVEKLFIAIKQFAKRQMTWLRRWEKQGAEIHWVKSKKEADKLVSEFL